MYGAILIGAANGCEHTQNGVQYDTCDASMFDLWLKWVWSVGDWSEQPESLGEVGTGHGGVQFGTEPCCSVSHSFPQLTGPQSRVPNCCFLRRPFGLLAFVDFGVAASRNHLSLDDKSQTI
jgi:hypothetical protein